jgi:hypothetical protein
MFEQWLRQEVSDSRSYQENDEDNDDDLLSRQSVDPQIDVLGVGLGANFAILKFREVLVLESNHNSTHIQQFYHFDIGELSSRFKERLVQSSYWEQPTAGDLFLPAIGSGAVTSSVSFRSSRALMDKFIASQVRLRKSQGISTSEFLSEVGATDFISVFSERIRGCIVNWLQEQRSTEFEQTINLYEFQSFLPTLQIRICDTFLLVPDLSHDFLVALYRDLRHFFDSKGKFKGSWGTLELLPGNLIQAKLSKLKVDTAGKFKRAQRIE